MAQLTVLMAGLLFLVESQASDVADRSTFQGFLSKYMPSGSDAPRSSMSNYDRFITSNLNHVKHGNVAESLSNRNNLAEPGPNMGLGSFTIVDGKPVLHPTTQVQDSKAFAAAMGELSRSSKDFNPPTIADGEEKQAVQELVTDENSKPITLSAIGIGLLSLAIMLGVRLQRGLQPATVLASSGGHGFLMPMNRASALGDNVMEMQSQDLHIDYSAAVLETRPAHKVKSNRFGWGQLSSQDSRPLTLCYANRRSKCKRALRYLAAPPKGVKRTIKYLKKHVPDAQTTKRVAKALVWSTAISPLLVSIHPALAYVGYMDDFEYRRANSGSMKVVLPATVAGILWTTSRQGAIQKKEIKRIKRAYKKVQEEEAEYMDVDGKAESDADIMKSLRNRTEGLADDDADNDDEAEDAAPPAADDAPPPPPAPKKRMTMAEKIKAKEEEMKKKKEGQ